MNKFLKRCHEKPRMRPVNGQWACWCFYKSPSGFVLGKVIVFGKSITEAWLKFEIKEQKTMFFSITGDAIAHD